ncbi:MAG: aspartate kinase [Flavobacteriales bacterium]|nr:aspartate kinase [Flavobacteriales bacterium]|tara:strand:+ start:9602 stop:10870 length:1269 start_codon:yes stop_codon:yes gene_type:complete
MKVFKFGGASVKDAQAVKNVANIINENREDALAVVVSAMGKTTNAFEKVLRAFYYKEGEAPELLQEIKDFHFEILYELFPDKKHKVYNDIHNTFIEVEWQIEDDPVGTFDFEYDQMVSLGEMLSTKIVSAYLTEQGIENKWLDVRDVLRTDNNYRKANVDWQLTKVLMQKVIGKYFEEQPNGIVVTQGFIGGTSENFTSTLGREGSDFSAAIIAASLAAKEVVIWKDVEGMLNADPKFFDKTVKLNNISYHEAIELAYFGASVIHPKTIKPLHNSKIPLFVKSFVNPSNRGTLINENSASDSLVPSYIHKEGQILISIAAKDFSFIAESNLSDIYKCFADRGVTINMMQNSAISFSVCVDDETPKIDELIKQLQKDYKVSYNKSVKLLTIRHYTEDIIDELIEGKTVLLEQKARKTARFVLK